MSDPNYLTIRLPLQIGPIERGEFWEDPLADILENKGIGEVTGGGTMLGDEGGIAYIDLEIAVPDMDASRLDQLQDAMIAIGAPKNTQILDDHGNTLRTFGTVSVVGIGLDGTGLPDSAYEGFDADEFSDEIVAALGDGYSYGGSHAGERYTFFYYHGPDSAHIETQLKTIADAKPIGQGAKIEHIA